MARGTPRIWFRAHPPIINIKVLFLVSNAVTQDHLARDEECREITAKIGSKSIISCREESHQPTCSSILPVNDTESRFRGCGITGSARSRSRSESRILGCLSWKVIADRHHRGSLGVLLRRPMSPEKASRRLGE